MKKLIALTLLLSLALSAGALAEDTGIQLIGPVRGTQEEETVNLDDWKVGQTAKIGGFAEITLIRAEVVDTIKNDSWGSGAYYYQFPSGDEAEYLLLEIDILNRQTKAVDYFKLIGSGVCTFEWEGLSYQYGCWYRQHISYNDEAVFKEKDTSYELDPMYRGKYIIVTTLPNDVIKSKDPLYVTFKIGENEFTYHHRR